MSKTKKQLHNLYFYPSGRILAIYVLIAVLCTTITTPAALGKPIITCKSRTKTTVTLKFSNAKGTDYYVLYRASSPNGKYKKIATTKKSSFKVKKLSASKTYYFKVKAVNTRKGKKNATRFSTRIKVAKFSNSHSSNKNNIPSQNASTNNPPNKTQAPPTGTTNTEPQTTKQPQTTEQPSTDNYRNQVLTLVNVERQKAGVAPLVLDETLSNAADQRAMELTSRFDHVRPDGSSCFTILNEFFISYHCCGENIAAGQNSPEYVMKSWMNSPGHKSNILDNEFQKIGIGYYHNTSSKGFHHYWVQCFTD